METTARSGVFFSFLFTISLHGQGNTPRKCSCHLWFGGNFLRCLVFGHVLQFVTRCSIAPKHYGWERERRNFRWKRPTATGF